MRDFWVVVRKSDNRICGDVFDWKLAEAVNKETHDVYSRKEWTELFKIRQSKL